MIDLNNPSLSAAELCAALNLSPHPEGGWYRETWRDVPVAPATRGAGSAIIFLLAEGQQSAWHRVDAAEIWLWHAGAQLELSIADGSATDKILLGPAIWIGLNSGLDRFGTDGIGFQSVVPPFAWQAARTTGAWSLVSCIVAPAFSFEGFELAPSGMLPGAGRRSQRE